jgi:hypothetical protein
MPQKRQDGRPRKHADRASKDRAYRERKKARDETRDEIGRADCRAGRLGHETRDETPAIQVPRDETREAVNAAGAFENAPKRQQGRRRQYADDAARQRACRARHEIQADADPPRRAFGGRRRPGGFCTIDKGDYRWSEDFREPLDNQGRRSIDKQQLSIVQCHRKGRLLR